MEQTRLEHLLIFVPCMIAVWFVVIRFLPRMLLSVYKKAILVKGFGDGPIPFNTLYMQPESIFENPLQASGSSLSTTGVNRDTLITIGWLDLRNGPQRLHVPDMDGRYYSVQFTDPTKNTVFAYIGKRTTGTQAGDYLITGPGWKGAPPQGVEQIVLPRTSFLIIGRVLVYGESDLSAAYALAKQIGLSPLAQ
ncbi:MAG: DUF1254 domain-containing protein [Clostridiales bacterium]|nr:DUF1254 domain-containing protein [Clostridiales bacterium]